MTTWTEAQIDRHLHLWEHRHGPDSPEAGIMRQLRAERDKAHTALKVYAAKQNWIGAEWDGLHAPRIAALDALPTTQETPHD